MSVSSIFGTPRACAGPIALALSLVSARLWAAAERKTRGRVDSGVGGEECHLLLCLKCRGTILKGTRHAVRVPSP